MNKLEKELMELVPYMKCGPRVEFQQRLQWLSEGMLRNHMECIIHYTPSETEKEQFKRFDEARIEMSKLTQKKEVKP